MNAIAFLLIAVVITVCGSTVVYIRQRPSTSVHSGVETFRRGLDALEGARLAQPPRQPPPERPGAAAESPSGPEDTASTLSNRDEASNTHRSQQQREL